VRYRILCKVLAALTLFSILIRWPAYSFGDAFGHGHTAAVVTILMVAMFVFGLASVAGLWGARKWGLIAFYPFVVLFTVLLGASMVPFVTQLLPVDARIYGVLIMNGSLLVLVALLHWKHPG